MKKTFDNVRNGHECDHFSTKKQIGFHMHVACSACFFQSTTVHSFRTFHDLFCPGAHPKSIDQKNSKKEKWTDFPMELASLYPAHAFRFPRLFNYCIFHMKCEISPATGLVCCPLPHYTVVDRSCSLNTTITSLPSRFFTIEPLKGHGCTGLCTLIRGELCTIENYDYT